MHGLKRLARGLLWWCIIASIAAAEPGVTAVVNGASFTESLAPGGWMTIFGTGLSDVTAQAESVPLPTTLGGVSVVVENRVAALSYVSPSQINAILPFGVDVVGFRRVALVVHGPRGPLPEFIIGLSRTAPGLFTRNSNGTGRAHVFDTSFRPVESVAPGDVVILYAAGLGPTEPPASTTGELDGRVRYLLDSVAVFIGEEPAEVLFAGAAPGFPGVYQINVRVPSPWTDRIVLSSNDWLSNIGEVGIVPGSSAIPVSASLDVLFPTRDSVVNWTLPLHAAKFTLQFEAKPGAEPFRMAVVGETGGSFIRIDPARGTFESFSSVPGVAARQGDFAAARWVVRDLTAFCIAFPGNVLPVARLGSAYMTTAASFPAPDGQFSGEPSGVVRASGQWAGSSWSGSFGDYAPIPCGIAPSRTTSFTAYVDGKKVARWDQTYRLK